MEIYQVNMLLEELEGDDNDVDAFGMDAMQRKRLKVGRLMQKKKVKPRQPMSSKMPYSMANIPKLPAGHEEIEMSSLRKREYLGERQKTRAGLDMGDLDKPTRPGAFKISSKTLKAFKKAGLMVNPEDYLFKSQRDIISKIPREKLATVWGADNMADAQDVIARSPKQAFRTWLKNVGKVEPRLAKGIRKFPELAPLWFYVVLTRVSGRAMADEILKQFFMTDASQSWRGKIKKEDRDSLGEEREYASPRQKGDVVRIENMLNWMEDHIKSARSALGKWKSSERMTPQLGNVKTMLSELQSTARVALRRVEKLSK